MARKGRARRFREARELKQGFDDGLFAEGERSRSPTPTTGRQRRPGATRTRSTPTTTGTRTTRCGWTKAAARRRDVPAARSPDARRGYESGCRGSGRSGSRSKRRIASATTSALIVTAARASASSDGDDDVRGVDLEVAAQARRACRRTRTRRCRAARTVRGRTGRSDRAPTS